MPKTAALTDKAKKEIAKLLEDYVAGVAETQAAINSRRDLGEVGKLLEGLDLSITSAFGRESNFNRRPVTKETISILQDAAHRLLVATRLSNRVSFDLSFSTLRDEIRVEVLESERKKPSFFNVIDRTLNILKAELQHHRLYLFPVTYTHETQPFDVEFGCLRIGDLKSFRDAHIWEDTEELDDWKRDFDNTYQEAWDRVEQRAKHLIVVTIDGYELSMGDIAARAAAEFFLNLLRLSFGWSSHKNVRILEDNAEPSNMPTLVLDHEAKPVSRTLSSGRSEFLPVKDGVSEEAIRSLSGYHFLKEVIDGIARSASSKSVSLRRIEYASFLIKTAHEQNSTRIALTNFVAALETLACLDNENSKKDTLSDRCSAIILDATDEERERIGRVIKRAYDARNNVVHGDAYAERDYYKIFRDLEPWLFSLVISAIDLLCYLEATHAPKSASQLRKVMREHFGDREKPKKGFARIIALMRMNFPALR